MTYFESAKDQMITRKRAVFEVIRHGASVADFLLEVGDHMTYPAQTVLTWLGY